MYVRALRMCKPHHVPYARRWKADKFYQNSAIAISVYLFTGGVATRNHWQTTGNDPSPWHGTSCQHKGRSAQKLLI